MSNAGTAKNFDLRGLLHNLFGNNEIEEENIETLEKIDTKTIDVTEKELDELRKSSSRINVLAERYGIEPKNLKAKSKTPKAKTAVIKKRNINQVKEIQEEEMDREER